MPPIRSAARMDANMGCRAVAAATRAGEIENFTKEDGQVQEHINISEVTSAWDVSSVLWLPLMPTPPSLHCQS